MSSYAQVPVDDEEDDDDIEMTGISTKVSMEEEEGFEDELPGDGVSRVPEMSFVEEQLLCGVWNRWEEPCLLSIAVTVFPLIPLLLMWMLTVYLFTGRLWSTWIFVFHLQLRLAVSSWYIKSTTTVSFRHRGLLRVICSIVTLVELALCGVVYPLIAHTLKTNFFLDVHGSWVQDWQPQVSFLKVLMGLGWLVVLARVVVGLGAVGVRTYKMMSTSNREWRPTFMELEVLADSTHRRMTRVFQTSSSLSTFLHFVCVISALSHFGPWPMTTLPQDCDDLDSTECALPFPSFHHMQRDSTSQTGWRVDLKGLPPLRGGIPFHPSFLNELDGFSTMAPILFYLEGMKEAHELKLDREIELQGPERLEYSTTQDSITLLINVDASTLVPHSAEVDYLDPERPLIMVTPAQPLNHATHYAVAVIGAVDQNGDLIAQTPGMQALAHDKDSDRKKRYTDQVVPALRQAAPWVKTNTHDFKGIQLLFDFVTISAESQLGPIRAVRDQTTKKIANWNWENHLELVKQEVHSCDDPYNRIARTLHVEIEVPSFLKHPHSRYSALDTWVLDHPEGIRTGHAMAMIQIPCSIERGILGQARGKNLKAIVEYGHGLFGDRSEVNDDYLTRMAEANGYILWSMEWRGMSRFDLPVMVKTLIGSPNHFRSVRDNIIQGYANKLAFQRFVRRGLLLWLKKQEGHYVPTVDPRYPPASIFYGNSQGGILGGGYLALAGPTDLIDRGVLGVPGTPFAFVMTRSLDFAGYDQLLLLNFYNNRHVRIVLSLVQMGFDSVEASGLLAPPLTEKLPRTLLQAGLGDSVVPTMAAEAMTRAMGGYIVPNNPREPFGIPYSPPLNMTWSGPDVTLTELMYEEEFSSLPMDDTQRPHNRVHLCVRKDNAMIRQIELFINSDQMTDPCVTDECRRDSAKC